MNNFQYHYLALHRLKRPPLLLLGWHDRRTYKTFLLLLELYLFCWLHKIDFFHYQSQTYPLSLLSSIIKRCRQENYIFRWKAVSITGLQTNHKKTFVNGIFIIYFYYYPLTVLVFDRLLIFSVIKSFLSLLGLEFIWRFLVGVGGPGAIFFHRRDTPCA